MDSVTTEGPIDATLRTSRYVAKQTQDLLLKKLPLRLAARSAEDGRLLRQIQGSTMLLDLKDQGISRELVLTGVHEKNSSEQLKREIEPGMTIVEVGANIGYYTLLESRFIGPRGHIYAFEPSPVNLRGLKINVLLNGLDSQVETFPYGIGNQTGTGRFFLTNKGNTSSFIARDDENGVHTTEVMDVPLTTLDDFFSTRPVSLDFLRMDVEGYELEVIDGMKQLLQTPRAPRKMFIEVHSALLHKRGSSGRQFIERLRSAGYQVSRSFFRGRLDISVSDTETLLQHPRLEDGYWETFFVRR
jgi:FkbM family methyltransferase